MTDFSTLTSSRGWGATPQDYNSLNLLTFSQDGSGRLVLGYGQSIFAEVRYRFEITLGILRLTYIDSSSDDLYFEQGKLGRRIIKAQNNAPRDLKYALNTGTFRGQMNMGSENGPFTYHFRWALALERPPYPETTVLPFGDLPSTGPYTYFGHPVLEERQIGRGTSY